MKKQGVPDDVIEAIVVKGNGASAPKATAALASGNSVVNSLEPGIYFMDEAANKPTQLEASVFTQAKTGSGILTSMTYGIAKTKSKAILNGPKANFVVNTSSPVFYFIFPHSDGSNFGSQSGGALSWYSSASSPNEFLLIKFKVAKKGREVVTGSFGTYSGFSGGIEEDSKVAFKFTKLSSGIYKVTLDKPIENGEYSFIFAGASATAMGGTPSQKAYDFSISK